MPCSKAWVASYIGEPVREKIDLWIGTGKSQKSPTITYIYTYKFDGKPWKGEFRVDLAMQTGRTEGHMGVLAPHAQITYFRDPNNHDNQANPKDEANILRLKNDGTDNVLRLAFENPELPHAPEELLTWFLKRAKAKAGTKSDPTDVKRSKPK